MTPRGHGDLAGVGLVDGGGLGSGLVRARGVVERGEVVLGVERGGAARAGGRDRLAVGVVDEVAGGEDAGHVGARRAAVDEDVAGLVGVHDALDELVARVVPDGDEEAGDGQLARLAGDGVAQRDAAELALAVDLGDLGVPREADLVVGEGAVGHDLARPQLGAAVDDRDGAGELRQEGRLLDGGVAAADDRDVLVAEEEAVAGRAPRDAVARELLLARQAELAVGRAHREDDRAGAVHGALAVGDGLDLAGEVDGCDVVGDELGAEALGLGAHAVHEVGAHDAVLEAGEVLDLGRVHQRATGRDGALEDEGGEVGAGGIDGGGVAGRAGADDDDVAHVGHGAAPVAALGLATRPAGTPGGRGCIGLNRS